ncbi:hypothetical protein WSTR_02025 [Wolbachia endosymbiont of Laodelphax striatellus]|uniref:WD1261 family protein n=1 Tax=Wolbachia endosymbiont of Laodelphax striatellus TaxID=368602 RepID=UPI0007C53A48|nr:hypothetical protein [Wolbachia endosymbiont of Laodelphax striatellus]OAB82185.1 hypothetical protein WSTR_02025 [Wolbachia endosymbiont of Laodelphax striatellus]
MVKEVEELIKIVGKGNLLEALFICLGSFQHVDLHCSMDCRNHLNLPAFIRKKEESLDKYFNLKFSLQGLFLIYAQAYEILSKNNKLSTKDVIDKIYKVIKESKLGKDINEVVDGRKLDLLNILANPKREPVFKTAGDFESKILTDVKKLLNEKSDKEFYFNKFVIDCYYSIHQEIKVDRDVALLFSLLYSLVGSYKKPLSPDKIAKREVLELDRNSLINGYKVSLSSILHHEINLTNEDGITKYTIDYDSVDRKEESLKYGYKLYPINTKNTLEQLLKNQNSDEFEQLVTSSENIHYSVPQKEKDHKNTFCKLALGMFILSVGLYAADYFFMEQKLFNSIKPQANLIIAAVLTIVVTYVLFQLLKSPRDPPHSAVNGAVHENLMQSHVR